ncbi:hypothetical protein ACWCXB_11400 [Streptomyces sp. NPDC001514]
MRRLPVTGAALAALASAALTGCGIQESDVIEAGGPATVQVFPHSRDGTVLFFRTPQGEPAPVIRPLKELLKEGAEDPGGPGGPTAAAVVALFDGPRADERAAGLTDGLPALGPGDPVVRAMPPERGGVEVTLPVALGSLDDLALRQLVCTIAFSEDAEGLTPVHLRGDDGALGQANCDADVDLGVLPRPTMSRRGLSG